MTAYQELGQECTRLCTSQKKLGAQKLHLNPSVSADGFDRWWKRTFALNTAVLAQASSLMRAHRRISSADGGQTGQAH